MEKCEMTFQGIIRRRGADIAWYAADRPSVANWSAGRDKVGLERGAYGIPPLR